MTCAWFILFTVFFGTTIGQIEDVRLHEFSEYGSNVGRLEILINGTWGTNCGYFDIRSANVACRMLGYARAVCASVKFRTQVEDSEPPAPILCGIHCNGNEESLDQCILDTSTCSFCRLTFFVFGGYSSVVCSNESSNILTLPEIGEIEMVNSTTRSIAVSWDAVRLPQRTDYSYRYRVVSVSESLTVYSITVPATNFTGKVIAVISNLVRGTQYTIRARLEASHSYCASISSNNQYGNYSQMVLLSTKKISNRIPNIQVRLVSPAVGVKYMGRVEVNGNGTWGSISATSSNFRRSAGDVICNQLNYSRSCSNVYNGQIGSGRGRVLLYGVSCSGTSEILDDCSFSFCNSNRRSCNHRNDVGVVCVPEPEEFLPAPTDFQITRSSGAIIRLRWKRYIFPRHASSYSTSRIILEYRVTDTNSTSRISLSRSSSVYTLRLRYGINITATIAAEARLTPNYGCLSKFRGARSEEVSLEITEEPPSTPPRSFHIAVVNCSTIRAEWLIPSYNNLNGVLRGYKLFYKRLGYNETVIDMSPNVTEYLITNLMQSTRYEVSVLAYTIGDGPRSIHLLATTNPKDICHTNIINVFGVNGNGIDRVTLTTVATSNILCGSTLPGVEIGWYYSNGSSIGNTNRHLREGNLVNRTRALQFGAFSKLNPCDSGVFICKANQSSSGKVEQRTVKVKIGRIPPSPAVPNIVNTTSNSVTFNWSVLACDGGYNVISYSARLIPHFDFYFSDYYPYFPPYFPYFPTFRYIHGLTSSSSIATFQDLQPSTNYDVQIRAVGQDNIYSYYSKQKTATTLPPAPLSPYNVSIVLENNVLQVSWKFAGLQRRSRSGSQGSLVFFTVYAIPFNSDPSSLSSLDQGNMLRTISKNFSAGVTSGSLTLNQQGVEYHVRVTATVYYSRSQKNVESPYSALSPESTIFVPILGLPTLSDFSVTGSTNTSISVSWSIPSTTDTISGFYLEYAAMIDGRSVQGNLIQYMHKGNVTVPASARSVTIQPLLPESQYLLKAAILTGRGEGAQVEVRGITDNAQSDLETISYFHVRFGPVLSCSSFRKDIEGQEEIVRTQILKYLNGVCKCALTSLNIESGLFSCGEKNHEIIYRAHVLGTGNFSATGLVNLLQTWIRSGQAFITIDSFRMKLDPSCPTILDTIDDPECATIPFTTSATTNDNQSGKPTSKVEVGKQTGSNNSVVLGVVVVGVIIAILLIILIVAVITVLIYKAKNNTRLLGSRVQHSKNIYNGKESDLAPIVDMEERKESSLFEEKLS